MSRVLTKIEWSIEDVEEALSWRYGAEAFLPTRLTAEDEQLTLAEAIEVVEAWSEAIVDRSVEVGWQVINEALDDAEREKERLLHLAQVAHDERNQ